jgi:hypothetical protein
MEAKTMTKKQQNNNQRTGYLAEIIILISGLLVISGPCCGLLLKNYLCHGAAGSSTKDALLAMRLPRSIMILLDYW